MILKHSDRLRELGGPGSGNWGHLGIPGYHGGSQAGSGGIHARPDNYKDKKGGEKKETIHTPKIETQEHNTRTQKEAFALQNQLRDEGYKVKVEDVYDENNKRSYKVIAEREVASGVKDSLVQLGGNHWKSADGKQERVYLKEDSIHKIIGLDLIRFNTGNISRAQFDGKSISNSEAKKIIGSYAFNPHYDITNDKVNVGDSTDRGRMVNKIATDYIKKLK